MSLPDDFETHPVGTGQRLQLALSVMDELFFIVLNHQDQDHLSEMMCEPEFCKKLAEYLHDRANDPDFVGFEDRLPQVSETDSDPGLQVLLDNIDPIAHDIVRDLFGEDK